jgi:hypothetical protein
MTNYDMDEMQRKQSEFGKDMIEHEKQLGKEEEPWETVEIELRDKDFTRIAREAHARDITFNKMVNVILKDAIKNAEYRHEHPSKPQLLNETK